MNPGQSVRDAFEDNLRHLAEIEWTPEQSFAFGCTIASCWSLDLDYLLTCQVIHTFLDRQEIYR